MKNAQSAFRQQPPIFIWCIRFCFFAVICLIGKFWLENNSMAWTGKLIFSCFVATCALAIMASFIRSRASLVYLVIATIAIPLIIFFAMDVLVLKGTWWQLLIAIPVQIGIPLVIAFYLWKAPNVRNYYLPEQK